MVTTEIWAGLRPGEETLTGEYLARFRDSHGVEIADALVAASATTSGLVLWTFNRNQYPMSDLRFFEL